MEKDWLDSRPKVMQVSVMEGRGRVRRRLDLDLGGWKRNHAEGEAAEEG